MRAISISCRKGGSGKTTLCHLLSVGAVWNNKQAVILHTDDRTPPTFERPYALIDCRDTDALVSTANNIMDSEHDGLMIIDSGGNRPETDRWLAEQCELVLIPVALSSEEDVRVALEHYESLKGSTAQIRFVINQAPAIHRLSAYDNQLLDLLPSALILAHLPTVKPSRVLLGSDPESGFKTPPTSVNNAARHLYRAVRDLLY